MSYSLLKLLIVVTLTSSISAAPATVYPIDFFFVTTTQSQPTKNSSNLTNVNATSLFDPFDQEAYLLRLIAPGYNSLPTFNLTNGTLHTIAAGILGFGTYEYNSTEVLDGSELQFLPSSQNKGNLGLEKGYLLTVRGKCEGWTICNGELGEEVVG